MSKSQSPDTETVTIFGNDGLKHHGIFWHVASPIAIVCIVHGFGEHIMRYDHVSKHLNSNNIAVLGMDLRGHGKSKGLRGHAKNYDVLIQDIEELLKTARSEYTDCPMFLYGHSMGGNLVINYVLKNNFNELSGFVASSPWLKLAFNPPQWKLKMASILSNLLPKLRQPSELDVKAISRDPAIVKAYENDPLIIGKISVGLFNSIIYGSNYALANIHKLKIHGLVYHGDHDKLIDFETTQDFAVKNPELIDWKPLNNFYHEPHNDIGKDEVLTLLSDWIISRSKLS